MINWHISHAGFPTGEVTTRWSITHEDDSNLGSHGDGGVVG